MQPKPAADRLIQWVRDHGGQFDTAIEVLHSPQYGYYCVARRVVDVKTTACKCPFRLTLSHLNVHAEPATGTGDLSDRSACSGLVDRVGRSTIAAFFLAEQRLRGQNSFWFPYIQSLPKEGRMTTPLWFREDSEELTYLNGTNLVPNDVPRESNSVGLRMGMYKEQWRLGIAALKDAGESAEAFTWELYLWAETMFTSRSFTSNILGTRVGESSFPILYPLVDMFNHRFGAKMEWQLSGGDFRLCLGELVEQGQQIFNDYAPKGNEELLMGYGFCIPDNPCDQVALRLGQVTPEIHRRLRERVPSHWLSETWNPEESVFYIRGKSHYTAGYTNRYEIPALNCLRGIAPELARSVYTILLANFERDTPSEVMEDDPRIWAGTIDALLQRAKAALLAITRWNPMLPESPSTAGAKAALIYRQGQVKILEEVTSELTAFIDPLCTGEISLEKAFRVQTG